MRLFGVAVRGAIVALALMAAQSGPAHAQGLLQKLLGSDPEPPQRMGPPPSLKSFGRTSPYGSYGSTYRFGFAPFYGMPRPPPATLYRTVCVRLCDGYYWPVSSVATRGRLYHDAGTCRSSCGTEARLFYLPRGSDDVAHMTDLTGRVYGRLPEAFLYRKEMVGGCTCKPEPWSAAELARHEAYAVAEAQQKEEAQAVAAAAPDAGGAEQQGDGTPGTVTETAALPQGQMPATAPARPRAQAQPARSPAKGVSSGWSPAPPPQFNPFTTP